MLPIIGDNKNNDKLEVDYTGPTLLEYIKQQDLAGMATFLAVFTMETDKQTGITYFYNPIKMCETTDEEESISAYKLWLRLPAPDNKMAN